METLKITGEKVAKSMGFRIHGIKWIKGNVKPLFKLSKFWDYCTGTGKSSTHSVAAILRKNYESAHDSENNKLIYLKSQLDSADINRPVLHKFLRGRDLCLYLDVIYSAFAGCCYEDFLRFFKTRNICTHSRLRYLC